MIVTITLPDNLAGLLQKRATAAHKSLDEYVAGVLAHDAAQLPASDDAQPAIHAAVEQIRALPLRNPASIVRATASLRDLLADGPKVTDFDEAAWSHAWAAVEAETDARDRQDALV